MHTKLAFCLMGMLMLAGCGQDAMQVERSQNGAEAQLIAVVEGCRLWRVYDGNRVYIAVCDGKSADVQSRVSAGKNGTRPQYTVGVEK